MDALFRYGLNQIFLKLVRLCNSASEQDMKLEEIVNNFVGYHPVNARLQKELRVGLRRCDRCNFHCVIETGKYGRCHSVANAGNTLVSVNYGLLTAVTTSVIENWDFFHFKLGSSVLGLASLFCNFRCDFCCNAPVTHIKCMHPKLLAQLVRHHLKPSDVVNMARKEKVSGIVFGVSEATMNLEFILDLAPLARQAGLFVALQSNGYMSSKTIELLADCVDAVVIGIKGFDDAILNERLLEHNVKYEHILDAIKQFHERGVHTEVTGLVLKSDSIETSARQTAKWLATNVSSEIPIGIIGFRATPLDSLSCDESDEVARIASVCRNSVLINVYNHEAQNIPTYCPNCGKIVVERRPRMNPFVGALAQPEFDIHYVALNVVEGKGYCASCGNAIYGVW